MSGLRDSLKIVVVSALCSVVLGGTAAWSASAAYDAMNAKKVDGFMAVGSTAGPSTRAGKLVATDKSGRLPNSIIAKAPDAAMLQGLSASAYQKSCANGAILARAIIDAASTVTPPPSTDAWSGNGVSSAWLCNGQQILAEHRSTGIVWVQFGSVKDTSSDPGTTGAIAQDRVTVVSPTQTGIVVSSSGPFQCNFNVPVDGDSICLAIDITNLAGTHTDGSFAITLQ